MFRIPEDYATAVTVEHLPQDQLTIASIEWPFAQPESTYTIDANAHVSVELDRRFPVRPSRIILTDYAHEPSTAELEQLVGEELAAAMCIAHFIGPGMLRLTLTDENRLAIAELQRHSPSTPALIKKACEFIATSVTQPARYP